jgi:hypothetical protein
VEAGHRRDLRLSRRGRYEAAMHAWA